MTNYEKHKDFFIKLLVELQASDKDLAKEMTKVYSNTWNEITSKDYFLKLLSALIRVTKDGDVMQCDGGTERPCGDCIFNRSIYCTIAASMWLEKELI